MSKKFLAINTAGATVEAVISCGGYFRDTDGRNASAALMPAVDRLLNEAGISLGELDYIACVIGPGSFTGIRIGVSSARALGFALSKPLAGINYLQTLAYNERADGYEKILCVSDASNGFAYVGEYDGARKESAPVRCIKLSDAVLKAQEYDGCVCADEKITPLISGAIPPAADCKSLLRAAETFENNLCDWSRLMPLYVRESQAESDLKAREANA